MPNIQHVDFLTNSSQKRYFLIISNTIGCQALLLGHTFQFFLPPLSRAGLVQQTVQIVVRFALTI